MFKDEQIPVQYPLIPVYFKPNKSMSCFLMSVLQASLSTPTSILQDHDFKMSIYSYTFLHSRRQEPSRSAAEPSPHQSTNRSIDQPNRLINQSAVYFSNNKEVVQTSSIIKGSFLYDYHNRAGVNRKWAGVDGGYV